MAWRHTNPPPHPHFDHSQQNTTNRNKTQQNAANGSPCLDCSLGKWSSPGLASCNNCLEGTYNDQTASTSIAACIGCSSGRYSTAGQAAASSSVCLACEEGKWQSSPASTSCVNCVEGQFNDQTASTSIAACTDCSSGRYSTAGQAAASSSNCQVCAVGSSTNINIRSTSCTACAGETPPRYKSFRTRC